MGVRIFPPFKVFLAGPALLFFFHRPFPRLVGLLGGFPVSLLARIVGRFLFAHGAPRKGNPATPRPFPRAGAASQPSPELHRPHLPTRFAGFARDGAAAPDAPPRLARHSDSTIVDTGDIEACHRRRTLGFGWKFRGRTSEIPYQALRLMVLRGRSDLTTRPSNHASFFAKSFSARANWCAARRSGPSGIARAFRIISIAA